jgi:hypothetical protein
MSRFSRSIKLPFKVFSIEKRKSLLWLLFTVICGLIGIGVNIWSHLSSMDLYNAIVHEFSVNSFYTYSIVLLTCTIGSIFMKIDTDKMITYTGIKEWILIALGAVVFIGAFLCQSQDRLSGSNWYQLFYFLLAIFLSIYGYCVVNMDRHPELFVEIQEQLSAQEAEEIKGMVDKMSNLTEDKKGNKV